MNGLHRCYKVMYQERELALIWGQCGALLDDKGWARFKCLTSAAGTTHTPAPEWKAVNINIISYTCVWNVNIKSPDISFGHVTWLVSSHAPGRLCRSVFSDDGTRDSTMFNCPSKVNTHKTSSLLSEFITSEACRRKITASHYYGNYDYMVFRSPVIVSV